MVAADGAIYVSNVFGTGDILKLDSSGRELARYDVRRSDWIDLASDGCTMLYSDEGPAIHRFNVCTNTALSDFTAGRGAGDTFAIRILPDGSVLAATESAITHYDASGTGVATYTIPSENRLFSLNLDPDGAHFWTGSLAGKAIYKLAISPVGPAVLSFDPQVVAGGGTGMAGSQSSASQLPRMDRQWPPARACYL